MSLFSLCYDALQEILKYLEKTDMDSLSLTSKYGYEITKEYFENKTMLRFSNVLFLNELSEISRFKRQYSEVFVNLEKYHNDEVIFSQLKYLNINPTIIGLKFDHVPNTNLFEIRNSISSLKLRYKSVKRVLLRLDCNDIAVPNDVDNYLENGILPSDISLISVFFDGFGDFDPKTFNLLMKKFYNLQTLLINGSFVTMEWPSNVPELHDKPSSLKNISFDTEINLHSNLLKVFHGLKSVSLNNYRNPIFLQGLLDLNKFSVKTLDLEISYQYPSDDGKRLMIPGQLENLYITAADIKDDVESLIVNQSSLKFLHLHSIEFTPRIMEILENNGISNLRIMNCVYNQSFGKNSISLSSIRKLSITRVDSNYLLPFTRNVEELEIKWMAYDLSYLDESIHFHKLNGIELRNLKILNIESLNRILLESFTSIQLYLPELNSLSCIFNLKILEKYNHIKKLEDTEIDLDSFKNLILILPLLEILRIELIDSSYIRRVLEYLDDISSKFVLKYIKIICKKCDKPTAIFAMEFMNRKGCIQFGVYKEHETENIVIEIDWINNKLLLMFVN